MSIAEGNSGTQTLTFTVSLSQPVDTNISVDYATASNTATSGSDFTTTTGTLTINAGQSSGTISVTISGDATVELDETFFVNLSHLIASSRDVSLTDNQATGTITNGSKES